MMQDLGAQRPIGELFSELAVETGTLLRKEVELAKVEMTEKAQTATRNAIQLGLGAAVAFMGASALLAGIVLLLGEAIPLWLSALLVGVAVSAVGAVLVRNGARSFKELDLVPRETVRTFEEGKRWVRREVTQ